MSLLLHIADRALNRPLLITRDKAAVIAAVLGGRIGIDASDLNPQASRFVGDDRRPGEIRPSLPYRLTAEGVAVISIVGTLVNRGAYLGASSGVVSYEGIKHQLATAAEDKEVKSVILDLSSPGGEAVGAFETADAVRALAARKETVAVVNGMACSAAYAIASAATRIVTTPTGVSGSIGVVLLHADHSGQLAKEGIKPTLIFAGAHKVDGNSFEPLSDAVRADLQAEVNEFYAVFLKSVAEGRGSRLTAAAAKATEGRAYIGGAAVRHGLADAIGSFESVLSDLTRKAIAARPRKGEARGPDSLSASTSPLTASGRPAAAPEPPAETIKALAPQAEAAARLNVAQLSLSGHEAEAYVATFVTSYIETGYRERIRIGAILKAPEAKNRREQALKLAFDTDIPADAAIQTLAAGAKIIMHPNLEAMMNSPANQLEYMMFPFANATPSPWDKFKGKSADELRSGDPRVVR